MRDNGSAAPKLEIDQLDSRLNSSQDRVAVNRKGGDGNGDGVGAHEA